MQTTSQQPIEPLKLIAILVLFAITCLCIASLIGCNPARKIERAEQIVKLNPASFYKIGLAWQLLNPCSNDSVVITIPGQAFTQHDTTSTIWHDSIYNWTYDTVRITKTIHKTDTIQISVTDKQQVKVWEDSARKQSLITADLRGQITEKDKEVKEANKTAATRLYWIIGILVALGLGIVAKIYFKL